MNTLAKGKDHTCRWRQGERKWVSHARETNGREITAFFDRRVSGDRREQRFRRVHCVISRVLPSLRAQLGSGRVALLMNRCLCIGVCVVRVMYDFAIFAWGGRWNTYYRCEFSTQVMADIFHAVKCRASLVKIVSYDWGPDVCSWNVIINWGIYSDW